jgi:hypothetical protein
MILNIFNGQFVLRALLTSTKSMLLITNTPTFLFTCHQLIYLKLVSDK